MKRKFLQPSILYGASFFFSLENEKKAAAARGDRLLSRIMRL